MKKLLLLSTLFFLLSAPACNKDDEDVAPTKTQLVSKTWKITELKVTIGTEVFDSLSVLPACALDNVVKILANGSYTYEEGATKCDPSDPQVVFSGNWSFQSNETKINLDGDIWDVVVLSPTLLKIRIVMPAEGEIPSFTIDITMVPM